MEKKEFIERAGVIKNLLNELYSDPNGIMNFDLFTAIELNMELKRVTESIVFKYYDKLFDTYKKCIPKDNTLSTFLKDLFGIRKRNFKKFKALLSKADLTPLSFEKLEYFRKTLGKYISKETKY